MFQEVFNNILSNLEYDNINYDVVTECGKTVIKIKCENGKIGKIIFDDTEENVEVGQHFIKNTNGAKMRKSNRRS